MAADFDHLLTSRFLLNWAQLLLLVSIIFTFPAYAVDTASDMPAISAIKNTEVESTEDSVSPSAPISKPTPLSNNGNDNNTAEAKPSTQSRILSTLSLPEPSTSSTITSESTNNAQIETRPTPLKDNDIQQRISGIFSEVDGLHAVNVSVTQGVVTLTGETPNEKKAQQAINLTNRLTDVVTVEDRINRTLDVQDNVTTVYQGLENQVRTLIRALPLLLVGIVIFVIVVWFGSWLSNRQKMWQRITPNPFVAELLAQTSKVIFIIIGLILALSLIGAETILGTLIGGAGVIGIAVGFAVKDTIENYIASLMLSIRQPFRARDHILINGKEGIVMRLTSRATILMTLDGNQLRIPNAEVFKSTILNYTKNPERRFSFELGVDTNDDPLAAIKVSIDVIRNLDFVLQKPKAIATIKEVGDSNIILEFKVWVNQIDTDFSKARSIAIREAKHALENTGFSLPEPIYRVRFDEGLEKSLTMLTMLPQYYERAQATTDKSLPSTAVEQTTKARHVEFDATEKQQAKARAKQILEGENTDDILNARPDEKLMEKVEQEIADHTNETDLLNSNSPQE